MNKWLLAGIRLAFIAFLVYGIYGNTHPAFRQAISKLYAGRYGFLTVIGLHLSILTIIIALIESMLGNTNLSLLFIGMALPIEILITLLFWGLYLYNPALLLSKKVIDAGGKISLPLNIAQHLAPAVFLSIEFALVSRKFRYSRTHVLCITAVSFGYFAWMYFLFSKDQRWVYPFINALNDFQRAMLLGASWVVCMLAYHAMHYAAISYHKESHQQPLKQKTK